MIAVAIFITISIVIGAMILTSSSGFKDSGFRKDDLWRGKGK